MANNKVIFGDQTIMDITDTTAEAADVAEGKYFYGADGVRTLGTASTSGGKVFYGYTSTTASTAGKIVNCPEFTADDLVKGTVIYIKFSATSSAPSMTLNINSTGAKNVERSGSTTSMEYICTANDTVAFIYDGTKWLVVNKPIASTGQGYGLTRLNNSVVLGNTTYAASSYAVYLANMSHKYGTCLTEATIATKDITCANYALANEGLISIQFGYANTVEGEIKLNVNSTGAKTVTTNNAATSATNPLTWEAGDMLQFVYSNNYFRFVSRSKPAMNPIIDAIYPVGSIYMSANSTNPGTLFGVGTWTQIEDTFLLAAGQTYTGGDTGGSADHTHEYKVRNAANWYVVTGPEEKLTNVYDYETGAYVDSTGAGTLSGGSRNKYATSANSESAAVSSRESIGNVERVSNMPPYLAVYVWQRIA